MISHQNQGLIELRAVTTMGVSVKSSDTPIGYFGTGLKFAICTLLRSGCSITIYRGLEPFTFTKELLAIRGQDFELVKMNGVETGWTTALGRNWTLLMAFRELHSNVLDEGGITRRGKLEPQEDWTTIHVEGEGYIQAYHQQNEMFLGNREIMDQVSSVQFVRSQGPSAIFYRGVKVSSVASDLSFNILSELPLTEDRTLGNLHSAASIVEDAYIGASNPEVFSRVFAPKPGTFECLLSFYSRYASEPFKAALAVRCKARDTISAAMRKLAQDLGFMSLIPETVSLSKVEQAQFNKAMRFLSAHGFEPTAPIVFTTELSNNTVGAVIENTIVISKRAFTNGTKYLAATLLEEHLHISEQLADESRNLQDRLFHLLVSAWEEQDGVPL